MPQQTSAAAPPPGNGTSSTDAVAAAVAQAKKEKRAAAVASMAPRMQSQVQKWAKMTAELGGGQRGVLIGDGEGGGGGSEDNNDDGGDDDAARPKKRTKIGTTDKRLQTTTTKKGLKSKKYTDQDALLPYAKQLRAPHRRDRYISFGVGRGLGRAAADKKNKAAAAVASTDTNTQALPPTCLLCLARFASRQQLRDHESLSAQHKRRLRDGDARKAAFQRYAKVEGGSPGEGSHAQEVAGEENTASPVQPPVRPPVHIKRIPRRRGDLAPTYTSYAAVVHADDDDVATASASPKHHHACLLCRRRFRSLATLRLHERESALHRARTRVPELVAAAAAAVQEHAQKEKQKEQKTTEEGRPHARPLLTMRPSQTRGANQYRDRARERRQAFGSRPTAAKDKDDDGVPSPAPPPTISKGAALLSRMGWSAGQGLGAQGGGLTEAIAPSAYRTGVGLGAQGGNMGDAAAVAARRTEAEGSSGGRAAAGSSYADFVEQAQEAARQRYRELDRAEAEAAAAAAAAAAAGADAGASSADADTAGDKMDVE